MSLKLFPFILFLHTFLSELCNGAAISNCIADERNALLNFKKNLIDQHNRLASWEHEDCCNWEGVSCNNITGHVVRLDLRNPQPNFVYYRPNEWALRGQLSPSLIGLKQLNYLDLSMNFFEGPIPKFVGSLRKLMYLNLSYSGFSGLIPHQLGNLSRLQYLHLDSFGFTVDHDARWASHITSLKHLTMTGTTFDNFQNWMEALNVLPNIAEITLSFCTIHTFPVSLPNVNFTNLSYLDLSYNYIELESIPLWLFNIKSLTHIDLEANTFRSIPDALKNLTSLEYINFSSNGFNGSLPDWFGELHELKTLNLGGNSLSGCIPESFRWPVALQELDLSRNILNGTVPKSIGQLSNLVLLDLHSTVFDGSLPADWFGELHELKELDLSMNNLNGTVPKSIGQLSNLVRLDLSWNGFDGSLPADLFGELHKLKELDLSYNNLNGTLPKSIGQLSSLVRLVLGDNRFVNGEDNKLEGVISEVHFASLTELKELRLPSNNLLTLNVSGDWIPPFKLNVIAIPSCRLGPKFPAWLQTQANISYLDMSSSGIEDTLPNWFWDVFATCSFDEPMHLDISNNGIAGTLPILSKLCFSDFRLGNNLFKGPLPPSLNISDTLDISNNSFSGSIQSIINNQAPSQIHLSRNKFSGEIPSAICLLDDVQGIDLSWNLLTGELPNCWNLGMFLSVLKVSGNKLTGNIPSTLRNCTQLIILDLGMNKLEGIIPTWIGENLTSLYILILSSNNFIGNVPSNFWKITDLRVLDLGNNKLSGRIPRSFGNFTAMIHVIGIYNVLTVEDIELTIKGRYRTYDNLFAQMTVIDLSCNNLSNHIPKELGNLYNLRYLNLSGNHLVGSIPNEIGLMYSLESLDLSSNELSGNIPLSMSNITMLNFLNLTYNNLSGKIPSGNQLQTLANDSYIGNPKLCGFPLTKSCDSDPIEPAEDPADEVSLLDCWYISIGPGFVLGFWIVFGTLFLKKKWSDAYFRYVDYVYDAVYVAIAVKIKNARKGDEGY